MGGIETRKSPVHGVGVFATRELAAGEVVARYRGTPTDREGTYVSYHDDETGTERRHEITGQLRFLNHSCRPNAKLARFRLVAIRPIRRGQEITIDYGEDACRCRRAVTEQETHE